MQTIDTETPEFRALVGRIIANKEPLSYSSIKTLLGDNAGYNFFAYKLHEKKETSALALGQMYDTVILDPENTARNLLIVADELGGNTKAYRELKEQAEKEGKELVRLADYQTAVFVRESIERGISKNLEGVIGAIFSAEAPKKKKFEQSLFFEFPYIEMRENSTGFCLPFRGEADVYAPNIDAIIDLKSTSRSKFGRWQYAKQFEDLHYDLQGAIYTRVFNCKDFYHVLVDTNTANVRVYKIPQTRLEEGKRKLFDAALVYENMRYILAELVSESPKGLDCENVRAQIGKYLEFDQDFTTHIL